MNSRTMTELIVNKAIALGAAAAGIANIQDLKSAPAFVMMPQRPHIDRVGAVENTTGLPEGVVAWKEEMRSVLVIAYEHPEEKPYLDCWLDGKNPPGNLELISGSKTPQLLQGLILLERIIFLSQKSMGRECA